MFEVLVASGAPLEIRPRWLTVSVTTHALAVALAAVLTQAALEAARVAPPDQVMLLFVPEPAPPPPPPPQEAEPRTSAPALVAEPPPKGFQTVATLRDIPTVIPPVDLTQRALDPRDFTGRGVEGGIAAGVVGGTGVVEEWTGAPADAIYEATTVDARFEQASLISQPTPRYPRTMETLGIEGRVMVEFVIDTAGRVQPSTVQALESSHPEFESAARDAVQGAVFGPARMSGHPVRQRTRQSIRFVKAR
jgi:protein TonB